jgi:hypothetical protein
MADGTYCEVCEAKYAATEDNELVCRDAGGNECARFARLTVSAYTANPTTGLMIQEACVSLLATEYPTFSG